MSWESDKSIKLFKTYKWFISLDDNPEYIFRNDSSRLSLCL